MRFFVVLNPLAQLLLIEPSCLIILARRWIFSFQHNLLCHSNVTFLLFLPSPDPAKAYLLSPKVSFFAMFESVANGLDLFKFHFNYSIVSYRNQDS